MRIAAAARVVQRFQRGRGAAQHHRHVQRLAAHQREVACVVADAVLLLVAAVVFLVDHDQPGLRQRREHRRACAHDHPRFAAQAGGPGAGAFAIVEAGMQRMHRHAQALAEACQRLRGQADLGHQHQCLASPAQAVGDGVQIDLGLSAAGHAIEQEGAEPRGADDRVGGGLLFVVERRTGPRRRSDGGRQGREALRQPALAQVARGGATRVHV